MAKQAPSLRFEVYLIFDPRNPPNRCGLAWHFFRRRQNFRSFVYKSIFWVLFSTPLVIFDFYLLFMSRFARPEVAQFYYELTNIGIVVPVLNQLFLATIYFNILYMLYPDKPHLAWRFLKIFPCVWLCYLTYRILSLKEFTYFDACGIMCHEGSPVF